MNDDLIYIDIVALIKAYEEALFKQIRKEPSDQLVKIAAITPLTYMQSNIEANIKSSEISFASVAQNIIDKRIKEEENTQLSLETQRFASTLKTTVNETQETYDNGTLTTWTEKTSHKKYHYDECSITDVNNKETTFINKDRKLKLKENNPFTEDFNPNKPVALSYKSRLTNDFESKLTLKVNKYIKDKTMNDGKYLALDKCLNCILDVELKLALPALEVIFDFSKILEEINRLINQLLQDLDPTKIIQMICDFLASLEKNFMCPQNLIGIQLLLPTLFGKYSFDLAKLRFDWIALLGPILEPLLTFLVTALENIPRITNALLDCLINTITTVLSMLQSIASSVDKVKDQAIEGIERASSFLYRNAQRIASIADAERTSDNVRQEVAAINKEFKKEFDKYLNEIDKLEIYPLIENFSNFLLLDKVSSSDKDPLDLLIKWYNEHLPQYGNAQQSFDSYYKPDDHLWEIQVEESLKQVSDLRSNYYNEATLLKKEQLRLKTIEETKYFKAVAFAEDKGGFDISPTWGEEYSWGSLDLTPATVNTHFNPSKGVNEFGINSDKINSDKTELNAADYFTAKWGVALQNNYKPIKAFDIPNANFRKFVDDNIVNNVNKLILKHLRNMKAWINNTIGSLIMSLKALNKFFQEVFDGEFKLLGEIQELLHLIRFVNMIVYLINNGINNCEDLKDIKKRQILANYLENKIVTNKIEGYQYSPMNVASRDESIKLGYNPDDYIVVKSSLNLENVSVINLNDCSNYQSQLDLNNEDVLDTVYATIKSQYDNGEMA